MRTTITTVIESTCPHPAACDRDHEELDALQRAVRHLKRVRVSLANATANFRPCDQSPQPPSENENGESRGSRNGQ